MKLFKKAKKGFTLIELVVVIAVIAILSTIAIISFISVTNKAKLSNDQMLVDQVNLALTAEETLNGKRNTVHETLVGLEDDGFRPENFKAESKDYQFVYVKDANRLALFKDGKLTYPKNVSASQKADICLFSNKGGDLRDGYSHYLTGENTISETSVQINGGLDVGYNTNIQTINYANSGSKQDVVIRTNSFATTVSINAPKDTVKHYGNAAVVNVEAIASASYHENGTVGRLSVESGHAVAEPEAIIFCFNNNGATEATPSTIEVKSGAIVYNNDGEAAGLEAVNTTTETFKDDCGAGHHDFGSQLVIDDRVYEVCKSCGYTLVTVVDLAGNETKTTMVDESTGEIVNTPIETYNDSATNELGQVVENKEEPIVETPAVSDHTDVTCNHNFVSTVSIEATCTQTGVKTFKCSICGASFTSNIPMKAHQYYDNIGGVHTADETCSICGHVRGDKVAKIGNTEYTTLTDAIGAVPTDGTQTKIVLVNDDAAYLTNDGGYAAWHIKTGQNVIIDLAGYTLKNLITFDSSSPTTPSFNNGVFRIANGASLTIMDSSCVNSTFDGTGRVYNQLAASVPQTYWSAEYTVNRCDDTILNCGNFTLMSGSLENYAEGDIVFVIDNLGSGAKQVMSCNIKGGKISSNTVCSLIRMWGAGSSGLYVNVEGGYFYSENTNAIWTHQGSTSNNFVKISGGLFECVGKPLNVSLASVNISGGTFINNIQAKWGYVFIEEDIVYSEDANWNKSVAYDSPWDSKTYWESQGYWFEPYPDGDYTVYYYTTFEDLYGDYFDNAHTVVNNDGTVTVVTNIQ